MADPDTKRFGGLRVVPKPLAEDLKVLIGDVFVHSDSLLAEYRLTCQAEIQSCEKFIFCHGKNMRPIHDPGLFERTFINVVASIIDDSPGLNHSIFAKTVWGDDQKEVNKWRRIRNGSKDGKPQKLLLSDAVKMTQVLQVDFASFAWQVTKHMEMSKKNPQRPTLPLPSGLPTGKTG